MRVKVEGRAAYLIATVAVVALLFSAPLALPARVLPILVTGLALLYLAYCWNIVGGIIGEMSMMHMVFWGIGAYTAVIIGEQFHELSIGPIALSLLIGSALAILFAIVTVYVARLIGAVGLYLAVFTLVVANMVTAAIVNLDLLGGDQGYILTITGFDVWTIYYVLATAVLGAAAVNALLLFSRVGLRWQAVRDDEMAAQSIGVDANSARLLAYCLSAGMTAVGGVLFTPYTGYALPSASLDVGFLILALLACYVGGSGTIHGPFVGTVILFGLAAVAQAVSTDLYVSLYAQLLQYSVAIILIWASLTKKNRGRIGPVSHLGESTSQVPKSKVGLRTGS